MKRNVTKAMKLMVFMDFSESSYMALKYAISMAKMAKGNIHLFHLGTSEDVDSDNQVAALRNIAKETRAISNKLISLVEIINSEDIFASFQYSLGNLAIELNIELEQAQPDMVILGVIVEKQKHQRKIFTHLLNNHSVPVLIVNSEREFKSSTKVSLGCNADFFEHYNPDLVLQLNKFVKEPITLIKINKSNMEEIDLSNIWKSLSQENGSAKLEYQESGDVASGLIKHTERNKVGLLCIGRGKKRGFFSNYFNMNKSSVSLKIIEAINIPVLIIKSINK